MVLTPEQVKEAKKQLKEQVKHLPPEQQAEAEEQIENLTPEMIEEMIRQQQVKTEVQQKRIFRMIVDGDIPSKKIDENKDAIAVVSKRAVSKGHILIIPKKEVKSVKDIPAGVMSLAKKIAKKFDSKLKAKGSEIQTEFAFGETVMNVMPVYDKHVGVNSERYEVTDDEMEEIFNKLKVVKKPKVIRAKKKSEKEKVLKLRRRIP